MIAVDPRYQKTMGSQLISFSDVYMINEHYECNGWIFYNYGEEFSKWNML